jgi:hypothetical protein
MAKKNAGVTAKTPMVPVLASDVKHPFEIGQTVTHAKHGNCFVDGLGRTDTDNPRDPLFNMMVRPVNGKGKKIDVKPQEMKDWWHAKPNKKTEKALKESQVKKGKTPKFKVGLWVNHCEEGTNIPARKIVKLRVIEGVQCADIGTEQSSHTWPLHELVYGKPVKEAKAEKKVVKTAIKSEQTNRAFAFPTTESIAAAQEENTVVSAIDPKSLFTKWTYVTISEFPGANDAQLSGLVMLPARGMIQHVADQGVSVLVRRKDGNTEKEDTVFFTWESAQEFLTVAPEANEDDAPKPKKAKKPTVVSFEQLPLMCVYTKEDGKTAYVKVGNTTAICAKNKKLVYGGDDRILAIPANPFGKKQYKVEKVRERKNTKVFPL